MIGVLINNTGNLMVCDNSDWNRLKQYNWYQEKSTGYARARINGKLCYFHRMVVDCEKGLVVDHKNQNKLDNRKCNLRCVSVSENLFNRGANKNNALGIKGVGFDKRRNKYYAKITIHRKNKFLGYFDTIEGAIKSRAEAEKILITWDDRAVNPLKEGANG